MKYPLIILALSVLVFLHELGHYLVARAFGMRVKVFSIGFGPVIARWRPKGSETVFQIAAIPVLAYVQIAGMSPQEPHDPHDRGSYQNSSALGRIFTIAAGPLANYLAATAIIFGVLVFAGVQRPLVHDVVPDSAAMAAGVHRGDVVLRVAGVAPSDVNELIETVNATRGRPFPLVLRRGGQPVTVQITAREDPQDHRFRIGIRPSSTGAERVPLSVTLRHSLLAPARIIVDQVQAIGRMVRGQERLQVMGPVGIVYETARVAEHSWRHAIDVFAVISLALFFFNLLPVPALDGGRLMFLAYELLLRRRPSPVFEARATAVSMVLLLSLSAIIIVRDIAQIASRG